MATKKLTVKLNEAYGIDNKEYLVDIMVDELGIYIRPHGYSDYSSTDGNGCPIMIEIVNGVPTVIVWGNINEEEPTHRADIEGAAESNRVEEKPAENNAPND